ncbi:hypothetical protein NP493_283g00013 [Ridgeia piscesae]|uniref:Peptidase S1 domain-containing protein n=1 Tax=Ridgeia piscesae TaxID=27915 RepID=A0AAD9UCB3_RIDPI|nr:hypothetical protein NP493_283g00013 [Ridgeia piscesae]
MILIIPVKHLSYGGKDPSSIQVVVGKHKLKRRETTQSTHKVAKIYMHAKYLRLTADYDIALFKLTTAINFTREVSPVCLPKKDVWDKMCDDRLGIYPRMTLNEVRVPVVTQAKCNRPMWYNNAITDRMLCAGYEDGGRDSCQGDSGGPLVCRTDGDGPWVLQGITSWGSELCATAKKPGVYTKVTAFLDWVDSTISANQIQAYKNRVIFPPEQKYTTKWMGFDLKNRPFVSATFHRLRRRFAPEANVAAIGRPKMAYLGLRC